MDKELFEELLKNWQGISYMVKEYTYLEILQQAAEILEMDVENLEQFPMGGYSKGKDSGAYQYVLEDMIKNISYYDWLYERLADDISQKVFTHLMQYRILPHISFIEQAFDGENHQYFDKAIVSCDKEEVFVDCGGFIGDTAEDYIAQYQRYKRIYVYEPSRDNIETCKENLKKYPDIVVRRCGVGEKNTIMAISNSTSSSSFLGVEKGEEDIEIVALDEDIKEKVTYIKMDIERFEIPAILGAKNHIRNDRPKLAICTYHIISDIWEIPKLIDCIEPNYQFYIRHYMKTQNWETVLYAIPVSEPQISCKRKKTRRVVAMAPYERGWSNVELVKDCGLIPYLLYKNHGCDVTMVGAEGQDYTYQDYIKGVKMEFLPNGREETKLQYMQEHSTNIDCLILRGCYPTNFNVAKLYKQLNPEGRIYVGLDANSIWMDRIIWDKEDFMEFMDCCDVIATSCSAMQEHLNVKWPWRIEHIPNGYYDFKQRNSSSSFAEKDNVILTVGRIGSEQKATNVLLEAYALIAEVLTDWKLRIVGNVQPEFNHYIEEYFGRFPELRERVSFVGSIQDREKLYEEYLRAKIFALPSTCEGGTPNVIAEALSAWCVTAVTRFDAYLEATDDGTCGMDAQINDIQGFAEILLELCNHKNLEEMSENATKYCREHFDMEMIVGKVSEMIFGGK